MSCFESGLLGRLREVTEQYSYSEISRQTGIHRESCRRYLVHGNPTLEFLSVLCRSLGVSAHWLLLGVGPRTLHENAGTWLHTVPPAEIWLELGRRWTANQRLVAELRERVVKLEARLPRGDAGAAGQSEVEPKLDLGFYQPPPIPTGGNPPGLPSDSGVKYDVPHGGAS